MRVVEGFGRRRWTVLLFLGVLVVALAGCAAQETGGVPGAAAAGEDGVPGEPGRAGVMATEPGGSHGEMAGMAGADHAAGGSHPAGMGMKVWYKTGWDGMTIQLASGRPASHTVFQGDEWVLVEPAPEERYHMMVVLADQVTGERIPYSSVWMTVEDEEGRLIFDERMWPMLSPNMGMHYGINLPLAEPGSYRVSIQVGPPLVTRHPEYQDRWLEPFTFETTVTWEGN